MLGPNCINYAHHDNVIKNIKVKSYCVKPSHLSNSIGVFIVKNNKLMKDVKYNKVKNIPTYFKKFKKGYKISTNEIWKAMCFLSTIKAIWEEKSMLYVKSGYIIEKLHEPTEIKVYVLLGNVIGYYYDNKKKEFNLYKVFKLAEKASSISGVDFVRIDIIYDDYEYRISEFTFNPGLRKYGLKVVNKYFYKLIEFHKNL